MISAIHKVAKEEIAGRSVLGRWDLHFYISLLGVQYALVTVFGSFIGMTVGLSGITIASSSLATFFMTRTARCDNTRFARSVNILVSIVLVVRNVDVRPAAAPLVCCR